MEWGLVLRPGLSSLLFPTQLTVDRYLDTIRCQLQKEKSGVLKITTWRIRDPNKSSLDLYHIPRDLILWKNIIRKEFRSVTDW